MARCPWRFAVFDLDGTLLDGRGAVASGAASGVERMLHAGLRTLVATGRSVAALRRLRLPPGFWDLFEPDVLADDGDTVWHRNTDTTTHRQFLDDGIVAALSTTGIDDLVVDCGGEHLATTRRAATIFALTFGLPRTALQIASTLPDLPVPRVTGFGNSDRLTDLLASHNCAVHALSGGHGVVVHPRTTCKAAALTELLADRYAESDLRAVLAFGDGRNDICLLAGCGTGVAVAGSHPEAVGAANVHLRQPLGTFLSGLDISEWETARPPVGPCSHAKHIESE